MPCFFLGGRHGNDGDEESAMDCMQPTSQYTPHNPTRERRRRRRRRRRVFYVRPRNKDACWNARRIRSVLEHSVPPPPRHQHQRLLRCLRDPSFANAEEEYQTSSSPPQPRPHAYRPTRNEKTTTTNQKRRRPSRMNYAKYSAFVTHHMFARGVRT